MVMPVCEKCGDCLGSDPTCSLHHFGQVEHDDIPEPFVPKKAPIGLDLDRVRNATHFSRQRLEDWIRDAELAWTDKEIEARLQAQQCRWCYYSRRRGVWAGQAFTHRDCDVCGTEMTFSSTNTNPICVPCAQEKDLCVICCGDITLANRRKLDRQIPYMGKHRKP